MPLPACASAEGGSGIPAPRSGLVLHALHAGAASRAPHAGRTGRRLPGPGRPAAVRASARTTTGVTRSPSSHAIITALDPGAGREQSPGPSAGCARPSHQQKLAWALEENRAAHRGRGSAPLRAILRLIEMLRRGRAGVVRPACRRCGRVVRIDKPLDGVRVCRNCTAQLPHRAVRPLRSHPRARHPRRAGRPICANCFVNDPDNLETCIGCGRVRRVERRTRRAALLPAALPLVLACSVCGRTAPCGISRVTGAAMVPAASAVGRVLSLRTPSSWSPAAR